MQILVIDDDSDERNALVALLILAQHTTSTADTTAEALSLAAAGRADCAIVGLLTPGIFSPTLIRQLRALAHPPRVVVLTGFSDPFAHDEARDAGAAAILVKPITFEQLLSQIQ